MVPLPPLVSRERREKERKDGEGDLAFLLWLDSLKKMKGKGGIPAEGRRPPFSANQVSKSHCGQSTAGHFAHDSTYVRTVRVE